MMIRLLQRVLRLTAVIFTVCVILQLVTGHQLNNHLVIGLLICSLGASLIRFVFFKDSLAYSSLYNQLLYILVVGLLVIAFNYGLNWEMSAAELAGNLLLVLATYVIVRALSYQRDRIEVKKMNEQLAERRKKHAP